MRLHDSPVTTERERKRREMKQIATIHLSWQHFICHIVEPSSAAFPPGTCVLLHTLTVCIQEFSFFIFLFFSRNEITHTQIHSRGGEEEEGEGTFFRSPSFPFDKVKMHSTGSPFASQREEKTQQRSNQILLLLLVVSLACLNGRRRRRRRVMQQAKEEKYTKKKKRLARGSIPKDKTHTHNVNNSNSRTHTRINCRCAETWSHNSSSSFTLYYGSTVDHFPSQVPTAEFCESSSSFFSFRILVQEMRR